MDYLGSGPVKGDLYRCCKQRCHLSGRKGRVYCNQAVWENRNDNLRRFGPIPRKSQAWKDLYGMPQSVERVFKSMKQSLRLEGH